MIIERTIRLLVNGRITEVKAEITDWIDNNGRQLSTAEVDGKLYKVIDRDYYGPIYGTSPKED